MSQLTIELPDSITADEARLILAIQLFVEERVSCGKAAELAGLTKPEFMEELGKREIAVVNYPADEVESDFRNA